MSKRKRVRMHTDVETELADLAREGGTVGQAGVANIEWQEQRIERFLAFAQKNFGGDGEDVATVDWMMLAHNVHSVMLQMVEPGMEPDEVRQMWHQAMTTFTVTAKHAIRTGRRHGGPPPPPPTPPLPPTPPPDHIFGL